MMLASGCGPESNTMVRREGGAYPAREKNYAIEVYYEDDVPPTSGVRIGCVQVLSHGQDMNAVKLEGELELKDLARGLGGDYVVAETPRVSRGGIYTYVCIRGLVYRARPAGGTE